MGFANRLAAMVLLCAVLCGCDVAVGLAGAAIWAIGAPAATEQEDGAKENVWPPHKVCDDDGCRYVYKGTP